MRDKIILFVLLISRQFVGCNESETTDIKMVTFNVEHSYANVMVCIFVLLVSVIKIAHTLAHSFTKFIPESSILLTVGLIIGYIINETSNHDSINLDENLFFNVLLPPIILEASFSIFHKTFAVNFLGVLMFAVVATLANFFLIGGCLVLLGKFDLLGVEAKSLNYARMDNGVIWMFSSLIVAVDPVAVLAIFQEINVDNNLYYLVFGESLLNDGVSVVLYRVMQIMTKLEKIEPILLLKAGLKFVFVCLGGAIVGGILSVFACIITRYTYKTPLSEPIIVTIIGYFSYICAEIFSWSGIISMITYGVIQAAYGFQNVTQKSLLTIKRLTKILSNLTESIIFLTIGIQITSFDYSLADNEIFIIWSIFLCTYFRFLVTLLVSALINKFNLCIQTIQWNEQFIISYGGLRGGIAFCLAILADNDKGIIYQATMVMVVYTIVFMGFTMKPLVKLLNIKIAQPEELSLFVQIQNSINDHLLAGIEEITGMKGRNAFLEAFKDIENKYIRNILQRDTVTQDEKIMKTFEKINLTMHMITTATSGTVHSEYYMKKLNPQLRNYMMDTMRSHDVGMLSAASLLAPVASRDNLFEPPSLHKVSTRYTDEGDPGNFMSRMAAIMRRKRRMLLISSQGHHMKDRKNSRISLKELSEAEPTTEKLSEY